MLKLIKGDSLLFKFQVKTSDDIVIDSDEIQSLFVTLKTNKSAKNFVLQKNIDDVKFSSNGYVHVMFNSDETERLKPLEYSGDIEITLKNGLRKTKLFQLSVVQDITTHGGDDND